MRVRHRDRGVHRHLSRPSADLEDAWTDVDGVEVFYRRSRNAADRPAMVHIHGFAMSGSYMLPTAERLSGEFDTIVPDLPGFGRSGKARRFLDVPDLARCTATFLDGLGVDRATLVGNSMGCAVITEFAHLFPERIDRAVLVAPAGGLHNQPFPVAARQIVLDLTREPLGLLPVAAPDYLRFGITSTKKLFEALTEYPNLERILQLTVPTMAVIGDRDPLMPPPGRLKEIEARNANGALLVVIEGAAHAIDFSHPGELANVIRRFVRDEAVVDDPESPGQAHAYRVQGSGTEPAV